MDRLADIIGLSINWVILGLSLGVVGAFVYIFIEIKKLESAMGENKGSGRKHLVGRGIRKEADVYELEDYLNYIERFNPIQVRYQVCEQLITIFPLLGILGTVSGLIRQLGDIDQMMEALALSMSTTFWGLVAAIVLKSVGALVINRKINELALDFDLFEQNYQMVKDKAEQESGEQ